SCAKRRSPQSFAARTLLEGKGPRDGALAALGEPLEHDRTRIAGLRRMDLLHQRVRVRDALAAELSDDVAGLKAEALGKRAVFDAVHDDAMGGFGQGVLL